MSALHEAVARAIRTAAFRHENRDDPLAIADAAIGVVLAEAQRAVAALPHYTAADGVGGGTSLCFDVDDVMAALSALADGADGS